MEYTYYAYICMVFSLQFHFSLIDCMRYFTIYDKSCKCILNKPHNLAEYFVKNLFIQVLSLGFFSGIDILTTTKMWLVYAKMGRVVGMSKIYTGRSKVKKYDVLKKTIIPHLIRQKI